MKQLSKNDLIGQSIKQIWRTPWWIEYEKYHYCDTFVELGNGVAFLLARQTPLEEHPIIARELDKSALEAENIEAISTDDSIICEVLTCEGCPSPVIALANKMFLQVDLYDSYYVGPIIWEFGEYIWNLEDFVTYWGHNPVDVSIFPMT